jgi:hypothetical protein
MPCHPLLIPWDTVRQDPDEAAHEGTGNKTRHQVHNARNCGPHPCHQISTPSTLYLPSNVAEYSTSPHDLYIV